MRKMKVLDLFSGIGGFSLGLERAGMETIAFCEIEEFPRKVLRKHWPDVPIFEDVRELHATDIEETIDVICGGYPCQPFSTAGKRRGKEDDRHLWPEYLRIIQELNPRWVIAENVAGHINMGLDAVLSDLENEGYKSWPFIIPAIAVDAKHRRDRVWILASNAKYLRSSEQERKHEWAKVVNGSGGNKLESWDDVANPNKIGRRGAHKQPRVFQKTSESSSYASSESRLNGREDTIGATWETEPGVGRVADGVPSRVDRIKGLGNAVIPQIPEIFGRAIIKAERSNK